MVKKATKAKKQKEILDPMMEILQEAQDGVIEDEKDKFEARRKKEKEERIKKIEEIDQRDREEKLGADLERNIRENETAEDLLKASLGDDVFQRDDKPGDAIALEKARENLDKEYNKAEGKETSKKEEPKPEAPTLSRDPDSEDVGKKPKESDKEKKEREEKMKRRLKLINGTLKTWDLSVSDMYDKEKSLTEAGQMVMAQVKVLELREGGEADLETLKKAEENLKQHREKWLSSKEAPTLSRDPDSEDVGDKWIEDLTKDPAEQTYIKERFEKILEIFKKNPANKELSEEKLREVAIKLSAEAFKKNKK